MWVDACIFTSWLLLPWFSAFFCWVTSSFPFFFRRNSKMSANGWLQFFVYSIVLLLTVKPVGLYLARVLDGKRTWLDPVLRPAERLIYKLSGVNAEHEMHWRQYAYA